MSPARSAPATTLDVEVLLAQRGARFVAGMDEVGRGALAGPASVGVVVLDVPALLAEKSVAGASQGGQAPSTPDGPGPRAPHPWEGVRDSKALSPARRAALAPTIGAWAAATAAVQSRWHIRCSSSCILYGHSGITNERGLVV